mmetsp:Transcript_36168/g.95472  ORF Transcript_36168/g.95472 Transcript_36168/m.95472 type:complete len:230 (-) Transcript_36168:354-1043(-)
MCAPVWGRNRRGRCHHFDCCIRGVGYIPGVAGQFGALRGPFRAVPSLHLPSAGGLCACYARSYACRPYVCVGCRAAPSRRARSWSRAYIIIIVSLRSRLGYSLAWATSTGLGETPASRDLGGARSARLREYLRAGVRVREGHVDRRLRFTLCSVGFRGRDQRAATRPATRRGRRLCAVRDAADLRSEAVQTAHGAALGQLVGELEQEFVRGWRSVSLQRFGAGAQKSHA